MLRSRGVEPCAACLLACQAHSLFSSPVRLSICLECVFVCLFGFFCLFVVFLFFVCFFAVVVFRVVTCSKYSDLEEQATNLLMRRC